MVREDREEAQRVYERSKQEKINQTVPENEMVVVDSAENGPVTELIHPPQEFNSGTALENGSENQSSPRVEHEQVMP